MPRLGSRKLLKLIKERLPDEVKIGRDKFFNILRDNDLLVKSRRIRPRTTNSYHFYRRYPNLIKEFKPYSAHQMWVSDITYISTDEGFKYLSLITDSYSRKIIGWELSEDLKAEHSIKALRMAIRQLPKGIKGTYHHSDRGVQYCSHKYVNTLKKRDFNISMTESGDPRDNAIAERINGILKVEWLYDVKFKNIDQARSYLQSTINTYNKSRPHMSINMMTPEMVHNMNGGIPRLWKNYNLINYNKRNNNLNSRISN